MRISAICNTFNEEVNIKELIENLKDCNETIIGDDESTDKTVEIAKSMGAKVFTRKKCLDTPTKEDIKAFETKYGWKPEFIIEDKLFNFYKVRNETLSKAKNDWIYFPDADERVIWDFKKITKILDTCDAIKCKFYHGTTSFNICKLFKKSKYQWVGRVHEVIGGSGKEVLVDESVMRIDHYNKESRQGTVLKCLEYEVITNNDIRSKFYMAREYFYRKEYEKAIKVYLEYLQTATWLPETAEANLYIAKCCWQINRGDESRKHCLEAIRINPDYKEAFIDMATYYYEPNKSKWLNIASRASNKDVLFINI